MRTTIFNNLSAFTYYGKVFVLVIFISNGASNLFAQQKIHSIYLLAGTNFSNYQIESVVIPQQESHSYIPNQISDQLIGFDAEVGIFNPISDIFFTTMGVRFSQQGGEKFYTSEQIQLTHQYVFNTITLPISIGIQTPIYSHFFRVFGGGFYGRVLTAYSANEKIETDILKHVKRNIFGYQLGVQYLIPTTFKTYWGITVSYKYGNIILEMGQSPTDVENTLKSKVLLFGLVYQF